MYPSIKFGVIEEAIWYFASQEDENGTKLINHVDREYLSTAIECIKFGMSNTLLDFDGKYYEYDGGKDVDIKGLTIGGYESAFLADLVMAYLLEVLEEEDKEFFSEMAYFKVYRDDGMAIIKEKRTGTQMQEWLQVFQDKANEITGNEYLKFTAVIWDQDSLEDGEGLKVKIDKSDFYPFLDMRLTWNDEGNLKYGVFLKPNKNLSI
jgi:hypothetical protein